MSEFIPGTIQREIEQYADTKALEAFRTAPPAFLLISAKRKNHR